MAQYPYENSGSGRWSDQKPGISPEAFSGQVQRSILSAYMMMFAGLLVTAAVSWLTYATGLLNYMIYNPMIALVLCIVQIGLAFGFTYAMARASLTVLRVMFFAYAFTLGLSLSSLIYAYSATVLFAAFLICAVYFACLAFVGYTTKKDMSKVGNVCLVALIVLCITQLIMMLFRTPMSIRLYSIVGLLIFTGLTIWDVQRLNTTMLSCQGEPVAQAKWSVFFALELYLDFVNIFMYVLRLLAAGSNRD